ncbi:hypothetical protein ES705_13414 [subsurface metagenome]
MNPFQYGGVVSGNAFCNREQEQEDLLRVIANCEKLFIYSERRLGKTSLIKQVMNKLSMKDYIAAYVDLWTTDCADSFITTVAKVFTESMGSTADMLLRTAKALFGSLAPGVTVDDEGKPVVTFGVRQLTEREPELEEVLDAPAKIADKEKKKVIVIFDEFQQILEYGTDIIERRLRSIIQHHKNVCYIFMGSRKHLIRGMFLDGSRPLYRSAGHYPLEPIKEEHWKPFIRERFKYTGKIITDETINKICHVTGGHPFYTQHLCHVLWERCEPGEAEKPDSIMSAIDILLQRESYAYTELWGSLKVNHRRLLKGLAREQPGVQPFSSEFIGNNTLKSPSNVQRASEVLLERDIIDRDNGSFVIIDRFFRIWINKTQDYR